MRHFTLATSALLGAAIFTTFPACALELPKPEDAQAQALLARANVDLSQLEAAWSFQRPPAKEWPCEAPIGHLYDIAGLLGALKPEQLPEGAKNPAEREKALRRSYRKMGLDYSPTQITYSNIVLVPVKASCADGKLDGETEFYVSYDAVSETKGAAFSPATQKMEETGTTTRQRREMMVRAGFKGGKPTGVSSEMARGTVEVQLVSQKGASTKSSDRSATFSWPDGVVSLMTMEMPLGGFLPFVKMDQKLMTMIMLTEGKYNRFFHYNGGDLILIGRENTRTNTRSMVSYTENFLKKLDPSAASMPAFQNYKPVVIGGKDMLQQETCTIEGVPAKVDPCPVD